MKLAPTPDNEAARLDALRRYDILDTLPEQAYDDLTHLAAQICGTPIALMTLVDKERQWFKSKIGLPSSESRRDISFCGHAVAEPEKLLIVPDARLDPRFSDNPFVTESPHIAFYAGAPLITGDGFALGTVCVIDQEARQLTPDQERALEALARQIVAQMELRRKMREMETMAKTRDTAMNELVRSQAQFNAFMENTPALTSIRNEKGRLVYVNTALSEHFGMPHEKVLALDPPELWGEAAAAIRQNDTQAFSENRLLSFEESVVAPDGRTNHWLSFKFPLPAEDGERRLACMSIDITERKYYERQMDVYQRKLEEAVSRLEELSVTDALTELRNKRSFLDTLETEFTRARRYTLPLALIMLDVDHFKQYNDTEGHPAGDEVLRRVGKILQAQCRPNDYLARYGGEEFAVLLRGTPKEGAFLVAERFRRALREHPWPRRKITASLGVAELTLAMPDYSALVTAADQALYSAKKAGRDRVMLAQ
ncbi:hypothetical protein DB346_01195 [Verrucomicrobia bacterium LW23]|nr:hypothetical protein DB346_01195 [Verrucomicrobia bacterium LW23]